MTRLLLDLDWDWDWMKERESKNKIEKIVQRSEIIVTFSSEFLRWLDIFFHRINYSRSPSNFFSLSRFISRAISTLERFGSCSEQTLNYDWVQRPIRIHHSTENRLRGSLISVDESCIFSFEMLEKKNLFITDEVCRERQYESKVKDFHWKILLQISFVWWYFKKVIMKGTSNAGWVNIIERHEMYL